MKNQIIASVRVWGSDSIGQVRVTVETMPATGEDTTAQAHDDELRKLVEGMGGAVTRYLRDHTPDEYQVLHTMKPQGAIALDLDDREDAVWLWKELAALLIRLKGSHVASDAARITALEKYTARLFSAAS